MLKRLADNLVGKIYHLSNILGPHLHSSTYEVIAPVPLMPCKSQTKRVQAQKQVPLEVKLVPYL